MAADELNNLDLHIVGFGDRSLDFSTACVYLISTNRHSATSKVQLITMASKIHIHKEAQLVATVPRNESYAALQCSVLLLKVTQIMKSLGLTVNNSILFCDAISTLISIGQNPGNFKHPSQTWLSGINANLYQLALITGQKKQDIPLFIDQKVRTNFADYMTKFNLVKDAPEKWYEFQQRLL